jgi:hypothetical protein
MVDEKRKQKVVVETKWCGMEDGGSNVEHETKGKIDAKSPYIKLALIRCDRITIRQGQGQQRLTTTRLPIGIEGLLEHGHRGRQRLD